MEATETKKPQTIRRMLVPDEQVLGLFRELEEIPQRILDAKTAEADAQLEVTKAAMALQEAQNCVDEMKAEALYEVQMEVTEDGKKKYANESQRGAATTKLLWANPHYREAADTLNVAKKAKILAEFRQGKTHNASGFAYNERARAFASAILIAGLSHESAINEQLERLYLWDSTLMGREKKAEEIFQYLKEQCNDTKASSTSET